MHRTISTGVLVLLLLLFTACTTNASRAKPVALDRALAARVRTIAIVPISQPARGALGVWDMREAPGLISQLEENIIKQGDRLRAAAEGQRFDLASEMTTAIKDRLEHAGYRVVEVKTPRPLGAAQDFLPSYAHLDPPADVYLDIFPLRVGYATGESGGGYRPYLAIPVRIVTATGDTIYSQVLHYGAAEQPFANYLAAPSRFESVDFDELAKGPAKLIGGLRDGINRIAQKIAGDVARGPTTMPR